MRRSAFVAAAVLLFAIPVAVWAATGQSGGALERQTARFTTTPEIHFGETTFDAVNGMSASLCTVDGVSATVTLTISGSGGTDAVLLRVKGGNQVLDPGPLRIALPADGSSTTVTALFARSFTNGSRAFSVEVGPQKDEVAGYTAGPGIVNFLFDRGTC